MSVQFWSLPNDAPFPVGLNEEFVRRRTVWDFSKGSADYNTTDWTQTLAAGGTIALAVPGVSFSRPTLRLRTAAIGDQAAAIQALKWIQMPPATPALPALIQSVCFEFAMTTTLQTNTFVAFGMGSGTATEFQALNGDMLTAGAGIAWQKQSGTTWRFVYKTAAGAIQTLLSGVGSTAFTQNRLLRCGWTIVHERSAGSPRCAQIYPFFQFQADDPDGIAASSPLDDPQAGGNPIFLPSTAGIYLDAATLGDAAATPCGLAMSHVGNVASTRDISVSRILYADNLVR